MKILVISQMFPCKRHPISAIFFANLMKELAPKIDELIIVTPRVYIPRFLTKIKKKWNKWFLDPMVSKENGMEIIRPYVLSLPGIKYDGINGVLMQYSLSSFVRNLIKTRNIDLILGYNMLPEGVAAVGLAKKFKLPVGFWAIGSDVNDTVKCNSINYYLSKKSIENSDVILTESKDLENKINKLSGKHINVKTFYKGIDISNFQNFLSRDVLIEKLKLNSEKKYILFVGRLIHKKGIFELAETFEIISKKYPEINLILIGEEFEKEKLLVKFKNVKVLDKVHFIGNIPYKDVAYYMKISDMIVFPSWAEGLPNVIMEAMAAGLPVVTTNVGGIPEILINGVTGLSVPAKNTGKLTKAVVSMIENQKLRECCIRNARELISEKFNVKKNAFHLLDVLKEIKNGKN